MNLTIFAQRMKQAREEKGLKQNELAKAVGVTPTTISAYEKSDDEGNGKKPTLENAQAIAKKLEVSLDWLSGMSNTATASYADFTAKDYFRSLVTVTMETSGYFDDSLQNGIIITNQDILRFLKKINDLIKVYRAGSIPEDLFNVCVDKIINDYNNYSVIGNCVLNDSETVDAEQSLFALINDTPDIGTGVYTTSVAKNYGYDDTRNVKFVISQKMIDEILNPKDRYDNGKHNSTQK